MLSAHDYRMTVPSACPLASRLLNVPLIASQRMRRSPWEPHRNTTTSSFVPLGFVLSNNVQDCHRWDASMIDILGPRSPAQSSNHLRYAADTTGVPGPVSVTGSGCWAVIVNTAAESCATATLGMPSERTAQMEINASVFKIVAPSKG